MKTRSVLAIRTDNRVMVSATTPVKTSMVTNKRLIGSVEPDSPDFASIPTHRPVKRVLRFSANQSPLELETPGGSRLSRVSRFGLGSLFSNIPMPTPPRLSYQATENKSQTANITPTLLEESREASYRRVRKRSCSQNSVMKKEGITEANGSATHYVNKSQLFSANNKAEWLHLVAHMIWDTKSQQAGNLVAGSVHANTEMLFIESKIGELVGFYPEGITLQVTAEVFINTHIAKTIKYEITAGRLVLPFEFDAQTQNKPHIVFKDYISKVIDGLVKADKKRSFGL